MCGIFGYHAFGHDTLSPETLSHMGALIKHRGPDDQGIASGQGWAIANQRLSIIDIQGGHQPFYSDDGKVAVVQNGEIFNYVELANDVRKAGNPCRTNSDTEVLLRLYELHGIDFLNRLNGMFAIAIRDDRVGVTHLVRDRIGVKPLYIWPVENKLVFGSEIKSMLVASANKPRLCQEALSHYLSFNYVPSPFTLFQGITHLPPGCRLEIDAKAARTFRWWNLADVHPIVEMTESDAIEEFNAILDDAVRLRMRCDVPFGAFLSGGVDSSSVVGLMSRHSTEQIRTFCIGFEDPRFDESAFAQQAADRFNTRHVCEIVKSDMLDLWPMATYHCDQPHGDISFLPTYRVSELAARHTKVVLTGDGGDELFAGYDKHQQFFASPQSQLAAPGQFQRQYFESISLFNVEQKSRLLQQSAGAYTNPEDSVEFACEVFSQVQHQDRINQVLYLDMQLLLSGNNLVKPDRMGMAVSLEARTPFLDYRMMEFGFRVPGHLKLKDGETKYIYKKAVAPLIGDELAYRKKQMFTVPVGEWFKKEKVQYCREHLKGLQSIEPSAGLKLLDDHITGVANNTREIRALISLAHWENAFGVHA